MRREHGLPDRANSRWITAERRAGIYSRDSFTCQYCSRVLAYGMEGITLDHADPAGGDASANLLTCCSGCNTAKGSMHWTEFLRSQFGGMSAGEIARVSEQMAKPVDIAEGARLHLERLKSFAPTKDRRIRHKTDYLQRRSEMAALEKIDKVDKVRLYTSKRKALGVMLIPHVLPRIESIVWDNRVFVRCGYAQYKEVTTYIAPSVEAMTEDADE